MQQLTGAAPWEISYSFTARSRTGKTLIRSIENITGRIRLLKMARGYEREVEAGRDFWQVMQERYRITLELTGGGVADIPAAGPLVVVSNHPYGILDGLAMGRILSAARGGEFKIIANNVFRKARDLDRVILPIDFAESDEAIRNNIAARRQALDYLGRGGAVGIFPGGTVSTSAKPFGPPMDPPWKTFTAKLIAKSGARVVPVFFEGHNSRLFQVASHLNFTLRMALLISEFGSRVGAPLRINIGQPLPDAEIERRRRDPVALTDYLREQTYGLSPDPVENRSYGLYLG
jgi:putative hemolysin